MKIGRSRWGFGVALAAALMLVLQSLTGAWAMGANPNPQTDLFGNVLCLTSGTDHGIPAPGTPDHSGLPDCCAVGCGMFSAVAAPPPGTGTIAAPLVTIVVVAVRVEPSAIRPLAYSPGNPRAPPSDV
ncbi:MAG: hypothetical protein Q8Q62_04375 [Mesorhizobium sp.]|nr:hypothetical protein [Mesorhizobium sp.]